MDSKWITVSVAFLLLTGCTRPEVPPQETQGPEIQRTIESTEEIQTPPVETTDEFIKIAPTPVSLAVEDARHFEAVLLDSPGEEPAAATGTATITAQANESSATLQVAVSPPPVKEIKMRPVRSSEESIPPVATAKAEEKKQQVEAPVTPSLTPQPAPSKTEVAQTPTAPLVLAQTTKKASASKEKLERIKKKLKDIDPSMVIYLDSRGNVASTGSPESIAGEAFRAGLADHPAAMELADLPKDRFGLVDWWQALKSGKIKPRDNIEIGVRSKRPMPIPDIVIKTKSKFQPEVIFSHKIHTSWIPKCNVCHPKIFKQKAGGHPEMHMTKIAAGQFCGRCHNRVAFPLEDCLRCHVKEKQKSRRSRTTTSTGQP